MKVAESCENVFYQIEILSDMNLYCKGINTPSVKPSVKRQGPIGMHCDAPKLVPDPFSSVRGSIVMYTMDPMYSIEQI